MKNSVPYDAFNNLIFCCSEYDNHHQNLKYKFEHIIRGVPDEWYEFMEALINFLQACELFLKTDLSYTSVCYK